MSIAINAARHTAPAQDDTFRGEYLQALRLIERLHRLLLDVIKDEFDRQGGAELNSVQALLLYNIGESELTAGELKTRGYYLGSNVSYNLKKLVDMGYIHYKRSDKDRRSVRVKLTSKGQKLWKTIDEMFDRHVKELLPNFAAEAEGITPAKVVSGEPPPRKPVMSFETLMRELSADREDR